MTGSQQASHPNDDDIPDPNGRADGEKMELFGSTGRESGRI